MSNRKSSHNSGRSPRSMRSGSPRPLTILPCSIPVSIRCASPSSSPGLKARSAWTRSAPTKTPASQLHSANSSYSMKMLQPNPATLWSSIVAAGNLASRVLVGLDTRATWEELVHGSILEVPVGDLHNQSVLLATSDQFRAAAALIELDGIARRVVLY